jgi:diadenosine tetraphosphatase ApaH/serine/threonine PP2A family protein phosphatase
VRVAILSDIHSNLEALQAALREIDRVGVDAIYCLGDIVGYNADPAACVDRVREHCDAVVMGNHDAAVAHEADVEVLPKDGQKAVAHNRAHLSEDQLAYLADLPLTLEVDGVTLVHATPDSPTAWRRLTTYPAAKEQFDHFTTDVCFIGHTHVPAVMADRLGVFQVRPGHRFLINVGSVGQPRDHNPKASFGIFDTASFEYRNVRLDYDVAAAAKKIRDTSDLPDRLARRLEEGF